jgi:cytochrome P450
MARKRASPIMINSFLQAACLDIAGAAVLSLDLGALGNPEQELIKSYIRPFQVGKKSPLFLKLLQILPPNLQYPAVAVVKTFLGIDVSTMKSLLRETIDQKLQLLDKEVELNTTVDLLDDLLHQGYTHISEQAILGHAQTTIAAALNMVSNQLAWAIYALSHPRHLHIQETLRCEIRSRFPCPPDCVTWEDFNSLPFLMATLNEILRVYPNVTHRSRVCKSATTLMDLPIPAGTVLTWPVYAINRNPEYWGSDAHVFRPERWLEEPDIGAETKRRDGYAFMTFGQGARKCPGEHYARAVMACMLLSLVGRFRFRKPENAADVFEDDGGKRIGFGIVMKADIYANVEEVSGWTRS